MSKGSTRLALYCCAALTACSGPATYRRPASNVAAPLPESLAKAFSLVDRLEKSGALKSEWAAHVEAPVVEISDHAQLEASLLTTGASEPQKAQARELLEQGHHLTLFPYLGAWALVSFEDDKPRVVARLN